ncbi:MAG: diguanylate cyclase [Chloroflexota bacterium]
MTVHEDFYKNVLDNLFDGVYFVNPERQIIYWNQGAEHISGFQAQEVLGKRCSEQLLMHADEEGNILCKTGCPLAKVMQDGQPREVEIYLHHKEGHRVPVRVRAKPIQDAQGKTIGAIEVFNDNTLFVAHRHRFHELQRLADRDPLTGAASRRFTEITLSAALKLFEQAGESFGVLFVDIDHFKNVNDSHGHLVGDQMLKIVADTMRYSLRASDFIGRWGGEEFLVILYEVAEKQFFAIAEKLCSLVEQNSLITDKGEVVVTISIGGTLVQPGDTMKTILQRADEHLYESKNAGKNRVTIR